MGIFGNMNKNAKRAIQMESISSDSFSVKKGLRQGCFLSPALFKIYIQERTGGENAQGWKLILGTSV